MILIDKNKETVTISGDGKTIAEELMAFEYALHDCSDRAYAVLFALMLERSLSENGILENVQDFLDTMKEDNEVKA